MPDAYDPFDNHNFDVLEENDPQYGMLVARCLQTGTTATANDPDTLRKLITEALQLHMALAVEQKNPEAIYFRQAPPDVWVRHHAATSICTEETVTIEVNVPTIPKRGVKSDLRIVRHLQGKTA